MNSAININTLPSNRCYIKIPYNFYFDNIGGGKPKSPNLGQAPSRKRTFTKISEDGKSGMIQKRKLSLSEDEGNFVF
jgi:hypothetical protein